MERCIGLFLIALLGAGCATVGNPAVKDQSVLDQTKSGRLERPMSVVCSANRPQLLS